MDLDNSSRTLRKVHRAESPSMRRLSSLSMDSPTKKREIIASVGAQMITPNQNSPKMITPNYHSSKIRRRSSVASHSSRETERPTKKCALQGLVACCILCLFSTTFFHIRYQLFEIGNESDHPQDQSKRTLVADLKSFSALANTSSPQNLGESDFIQGILKDIKDKEDLDEETSGTIYPATEAVVVEDSQVSKELQENLSKEEMPKDHATLNSIDDEATEVPSSNASEETDAKKEESNGDGLSKNTNAETASDSNQIEKNEESNGEGLSRTGSEKVSDSMVLATDEKVLPTAESPTSTKRTSEKKTPTPKQLPPANKMKRLTVIHRGVLRKIPSSGKSQTAAGLPKTSNDEGTDPSPKTAKKAEGVPKKKRAKKGDVVQKTAKKGGAPPKQKKATKGDGTRKKATKGGAPLPKQKKATKGDGTQKTAKKGGAPPKKKKANKGAKKANGIPKNVKNSKKDEGAKKEGGVPKKAGDGQPNESDEKMNIEANVEKDQNKGEVARKGEFKVGSEKAAAADEEEEEDDDDDDDELEDDEGTETPTEVSTSAPTPDKEEVMKQCKLEQNVFESARKERIAEADDDGDDNTQKREQSANPLKKDTVLVIASVPMDNEHALALWSELECFAGSSYEHVIISTAYWAKPIINRLVEEARKSIPHFASGDVTIEVNTYDNKKYDAGLWCDALMGIKNRYKRFGLLNDSIYAIKPFDSVMKTLVKNNRSMTSLSYHHDESPSEWVESIYRGFDRTGLEIFMERSCVPTEHGSFCPRELNTARKKRCIVEYFEVGMAWQFPRQKDQVEGIFPGTVPDDFRKLSGNNFPTWVCNKDFWEDVLLPFGFPAAKVNCAAQIPNIQDPMLDKCTMHLDRTLLCELDFSGALRTIKYPKEVIKI